MWVVLWVNFLGRTHRRIYGLMRWFAALSGLLVP